MKAQALTQQQRTWRQGVTISVIGVLAMFSIILLRAVFPDAGTANAASTPPGVSLTSAGQMYLYGANDAYDWAGSAGFDNSATIQSQVKAAHVPLIRAWFPQYPNFAKSGTQYSDAHQLAIAQTVTNTGAACMAVLYQNNSQAYDLHLVSLLAPYCRYFEIGNEPDDSGGGAYMAPSAYVALWNSLVPQARALDPIAEFGGPALGNEFGLSSSTYMQSVLQGMAQGGVWPDFVTFHWYICVGYTQSQCLSVMPSQTAGHGKTVAGWLKQYFPGKTVALGITEWSADPGNPKWAYDDTWMSQFEQVALTGFAQNPYLQFATQYDLASYAGYGTLDMFRTSYPEVTSGSTIIDYTNTPQALGSARPMFGVLANAIAHAPVAGGGGGSATPTPGTVQPTSTSVPPTPTTAPGVTPTVPPVEPTPTVVSGGGGGSGGVPCVELVNGVMTVGTCVGTFTPSGSSGTK